MFHSLTLFNSQLILSSFPSLEVKQGHVEAIRYRSPIALSMSSIVHSSTPTGSMRIFSPEQSSSATIMPLGLASSTRVGSFQLSGQNIGVPVTSTRGVSGEQTQSFLCTLFSNSSHNASVFSVHRTLSSHKYA